MNPNLYGVVISSSLNCKDGRQMINGKVVGIAWFNEWVASEEYRPWLGEWDSASYRKVPYIVLKKGRDTYFVHLREVNMDLEKLLNELLISMAAPKKKYRES